MADDAETPPPTTAHRQVIERFQCPHCPYMVSAVTREAAMAGARDHEAYVHPSGRVQ